VTAGAHDGAEREEATSSTEELDQDTVDDGYGDDGAATTTSNTTSGLTGTPSSMVTPASMVGGDEYSGSTVPQVGELNVAALAGRLVEAKVLLPSSKCGIIIGKGGSMIKHIREVTKASMDVAEQLLPNATAQLAPTSERVVTICGEFGAVYGALALALRHLATVAAAAAGAENAVAPSASAIIDLTLLVPRNKTGGLIGRSGAAVNRVRQDSGATVKVASPEDMVMGEPDVRKCLISGTLDQVLAAFVLVMHKLEETPVGASRPPEAAQAGMHDMAMYHQGITGMSQGSAPMQQQHQGSMPVQFQVPNESMGAVIGRAGATINQIRQMSGAKVDIAQSVPGMPMRLVTITGTPDQIQMAQYLIQVKMGGGTLPSYGNMQGGGQQQGGGGHDYQQQLQQQEQLQQQQQLQYQQQGYSQQDYMNQMQQQQLMQQQQQQQQQMGGYGAYPAF